MFERQHPSALISSPSRTPLRHFTKQHRFKDTMAEKDIEFQDVDQLPEKTHGEIIHVVDQEAEGYVDPTLVLSEAENKRLRRRVHLRWVMSL